MAKSGRMFVVCSLPKPTFDLFEKAVETKDSDSGSVSFGADLEGLVFAMPSGQTYTAHGTVLIQGSVSGCGAAISGSDPDT